MPTYVALAQITNQELQDMAGAISRVRSGVQRATAAGLKVTGAFFTLLDDYDQLMVVEAPDDQTAHEHVLDMVGQDNVRTRMLRAFTLDEVEQRLSQVGVWTS